MAIRSYEPASLSSLTELVQTRFPRELRDHVYSFFWDDDTTAYLGSDYQKHLTRSVPCPGFPDTDVNLACKSKLPKTMPAFTRSNLVGYQFAHEAVLWLYDNYETLETRGIEDLRSFPETEVFYVALSPASAKSIRLRRLALWIDLAQSHDIPKNLHNSPNASFGAASPLISLFSTYPTACTPSLLP